MMHDSKTFWTQLCTKEGITPSHDEGSTVIMDDCFLFAANEDNAFLIVRCVCHVPRKQNLTWKLKKCQWFPEKIEFAGADVSQEGNAPAASKSERLTAWKTPNTSR